MPGARLLLRAKCPRCLASLLCPGLPVDGLPSLDLVACVRGTAGHVHLSQVYGSFEKLFLGVPDVPGSREEFRCSRCGEPLPVKGPCACGADLVEVELEEGGLLRFCTRNGCREHHLEFEEPDDAFLLYDSQDE